MSILKFGLWNVGLASKRCVGEDVDRLISLLALVLDGVDFFVLLEVSKREFEYIHAALYGFGFQVVDAFDKVGARQQFDMICIFRSSKVSVVKAGHVVVPYAGRKYKAAMRFDVIATCGSVIHVFSSHWPSRIFSAPDNVSRAMLGRAIASEYKDLPYGEGSAPFVVLMGDYNAEPYEECIYRSIGASRDPDLVANSRDLFFNPFWKYLIHDRLFNVNGTYFYKAGWEGKWKVYDQIMFSSAFLRNGERWNLDVDGAIVFRHEDVVEAASVGGGRFDHYPVLCSILGR